MSDIKRAFEKMNPIEPVKAEMLEVILTSKPKSNRTKRFFVSAGTIAASFFICIFAMTNVSLATYEALQGIPIIGQIASFLTIQNFKQEDSGVSINIEIPKISGLENNAAQETLNEAIGSYTDSLVAEYEEMVQLNKEAIKENPELSKSLTFGSSIDCRCYVKTDDDRYFSLELVTGVTMASGSQSTAHFTVDKQTGHLLKVTDLFTDSLNSDSILSNIKAQMNKRMSEDSNLIYSPDELVPIDEDTNFYINEDGKIVICYDEYEAAPGYMGALEFVIE